MTADGESARSYMNRVYSFSVAVMIAGLIGPLDRAILREHSAWYWTTWRR